MQTILTEFKSQYTNLVTRYNKSATAAWARGDISPEQQKLDLKLLFQQRDDLVAATRAAITKQLSQEGATRVSEHIQAEKKHMKLHVSKESQ